MSSFIDEMLHRLRYPYPMLLFLLFLKLSFSSFGGVDGAGRIRVLVVAREDYVNLLKQGDSQTERMQTSIITDLRAFEPSDLGRVYRTTATTESPIAPLVKIVGIASLEVSIVTLSIQEIAKAKGDGAITQLSQTRALQYIEDNHLEEYASPITCIVFVKNIEDI